MTPENTIFEADQTLADYLISNGFKETTDDDYKRRGKREFSKGRKKRILFDYINIVLFIWNGGEHHRPTIDKNRLLAFFNCKDWRDYDTRNRNI